MHHDPTPLFSLDWLSRALARLNQVEELRGGVLKDACISIQSCLHRAIAQVKDKRKNSENIQGPAMKLEIVSSASPSGINHQFLMTYLVNDTVAIDAGALGLMPDVDRQRCVRDVFLSHSHIDHIASLPIFLDNVYEYGRPCVCVHASPQTIATLRSDLFNERLWPDLIRLSREESAFLELKPIEAGETIRIGSLSIRGIWLNHVIPTLGFIITEDDRTSVAIVSDTGPTEEIWQELDRSPGPRAVFLDISFPNRLCWLGEKSKHLCPQLAAHEVAKVRSPVDWQIIHIKPAFHDEIVNELRTAVPQARIAEPGSVIEL